MVQRTKEMIACGLRKLRRPYSNDRVYRILNKAEVNSNLALGYLERVRVYELAYRRQEAVDGLAESARQEQEYLMRLAKEDSSDANINRVLGQMKDVDTWDHMKRVAQQPGIAGITIDFYVSQKEALEEYEAQRDSGCMDKALDRSAMLRGKQLTIESRISEIDSKEQEVFKNPVFAGMLPKRMRGRYIQRG